MIVTVSGSSGLTNAYRSELSATGSLLISGASRCDDAVLFPSALSRLEQLGGELLVGERALRATDEHVERALLGVAQRQDQRAGSPGGLPGLAGQAQPGHPGHGDPDTGGGGDRQNAAAVHAS